MHGPMNIFFFLGRIFTSAVLVHTGYVPNEIEKTVLY